MAAEAGEVNAVAVAEGAAHRTVAALHMAADLLVAAVGKGAADLAGDFRRLAAVVPMVAEPAADNSVIAARAARAAAAAGPARERAVPVALVLAEVDRARGPEVRGGVAQARVAQDKPASARAVSVGPEPERAVQVRPVSVDLARVPAALLDGQGLEPAEQVAQEWEHPVRGQSQVGRERAPVAWADLIVVSEFVPAREQAPPV